MVTRKDKKVVQAVIHDELGFVVLRSQLSPLRIIKYKCLLEAGLAESIGTRTSGCGLESHPLAQVRQFSPVLRSTCSMLRSSLARGDRMN